MRRLSLEEAVTCLKQSGLILFPTDTSFGLGCRAYDSTATGRLVYAKGRPNGKPLPVLLPSLAYLRGRNIETPLIALAEAFWPGPLTLVVPAFPGLAAEVTGGTQMVGVRISAHPLAQALVEAIGEPVVATSANRSGEPAACSLEDVDKLQLNNVDGVLCDQALMNAPAVDPKDVRGSTVVGLQQGDLVIFRQGPISEEQLRKVWNAVR